MNHYSQYGEEAILHEFFRQKRNGVVVDIGAADGVDNSNSKYLIEEYEWSGILLEPHPSFYRKLKNLYQNNNKVTTINSAVYKFTGKDLLEFHIYGEDSDAQVSTISNVFMEKVINVHGNKYQKSIKVDSITLKDLFSNLNVTRIDFLSIDCEGVDMDVLQSNDWNLYRPDLVCVEHSMPEQELISFITSIDYKLYAKTTGNSFFVKNT